MLLLGIVADANKNGMDDKNMKLNTKAGFFSKFLYFIILNSLHQVRKINMYQTFNCFCNSHLYIFTIIIYKEL